MRERDKEKRERETEGETKVLRGSVSAVPGRIEKSLFDTLLKQTK